MAKFEKGHKKLAGRTKGSVNKTTKDIKEAFRMLIEDNIPNLTIWLKKVGDKNPAQALFFISALAEYNTPKQARINHVSEDGSMSPKANIIVSNKETKQELEKLINE